MRVAKRLASPRGVRLSNPRAQFAPRLCSCQEGHRPAWGVRLIRVRTWAVGMVLLRTTVTQGGWLGGWVSEWW